MFRAIFPERPVKKTWFFFLSAALLSLLFCGGLHAQRIDEKLVIRLKTEGCAAMRTQEKSLDNIHLVWRLSSPNFVLENEIFCEEGDYLLKGTSVALPQDEGFRPHKFYAAKNKSYFFEISYRDEGPWQINSFHKTKDFSIQESFPIFAARALLPFFVKSRPLADLIQDPNLRIVKIESIPGPPEETVSFEFENSAKGLIDSSDSVVKWGHVVLLPERNWAISEIILDIDEEGKSTHFKKNYIFDDSPDPSFPIKEVHSKMAQDPGDGSGQTVAEFKQTVLLCDNERLPQKETRLKYYGLSKPDLRTPIEKTLLRILFALGAVLFLLALRKKYDELRRRRKGRRSHPGRRQDFWEEEDEPDDEDEEDEEDEEDSGSEEDEEAPGEPDRADS